MKKLSVLLLALVLSACSSVTIQPEQIAKLSSQPTYHDSRHFFLWGLIGEERVNVKQICGENKVLQMQSQQTLADGALGLITLGIYSPHSVKVWCDSQAVTIPMEVKHEG